MVVRFDDVKVGEQFVVGTCTYTKTEEHYQMWNTPLGEVRLGHVNAYHSSVLKDKVEDYFGPGSMVEVRRE